MGNSLDNLLQARMSIISKYKLSNKFIFISSIIIFALGVYSTVFNNYLLSLGSRFIIFILIIYLTVQQFRLRRLELDILNSIKLKEDVDYLKDDLNSLDISKYRVNLISKITVTLGGLMFICSLLILVIYKINIFEYISRILFYIFIILSFLEYNTSKKISAIIDKYSNSYK